MRNALLVLSVLVPTVASAQSEQPKPANPGEEAPAELARTPADEAPKAENAPVPAVTPVPAVVPAPAPKPAGPTADVGVRRPSEPPAAVEGSKLTTKVSASLRVGALGSSAFPVDTLGTPLSPTPVEERLRLSAEARYGGFGLIGEIDGASGAISGLPPSELVAPRMPNPGFRALDLRQLYGEYKGATWVVRAGQQGAQWGLGLVANNGAKDAEVGDFGDAYFGDISYRVLLAGRPLFGLGGAFRAIEPAVGIDLVMRDDTADFFAGDRALQGIFALRFAVDADHYFGVYSVLRRQRAEGVTDGGRQTDAFVVDLAGKWLFGKKGRDNVSLGFELVSISGTSTQTRSDTAPVMQVQQLGAAVRTAAESGNLTAFFDFGYASGDQNPFDDRLENFRFDPDYHAGLVLFDQVLGWQSARSAARASDPNLVGVAPEGVHLLPTRGAVTGAWYLFPRLRYGIEEWLDVYGGPLFAFSTARMIDPFTSRVNGGGPLNAWGGEPGRHLGTELDVGVQARWKPHATTTVTATAEGGYFLPGDAFALPGGGNLPPVVVGRLRLGVGI
ncbi:MAG: hypothetical protein ACOZIN_11195 [Myxococcota bacterium]